MKFSSNTFRGNYNRWIRGWKRGRRGIEVFLTDLENERLKQEYRVAINADDEDAHETALREQDEFEQTAEGVGVGYYRKGYLIGIDLEKSLEKDLVIELYKNVIQIYIQVTRDQFKKIDLLARILSYKTITTKSILYYNR